MIHFLLRGIPAALIPCYFFSLVAGLFSTFGVEKTQKIGLNMNEYVLYPIFFCLGGALFFFLFFLLPLATYRRYHPASRLINFAQDFPNTLRHKDAIGRKKLFGSLLINYSAIAVSISLMTHIIFGLLTLFLCLALVALSYYCKK